MDANPYESPREAGYDPRDPAVEPEPEPWIGVVLWIVTLGLGAVVVGGLLARP